MAQAAAGQVEPQTLLQTLTESCQQLASTAILPHPGWQTGALLNSIVFGLGYKVSSAHFPIPQLPHLPHMPCSCISCAPCARPSCATATLHS